MVIRVVLRRSDKVLMKLLFNVAEELLQHSNVYKLNAIEKNFTSTEKNRAIKREEGEPPPSSYQLTQI